MSIERTARIIHSYLYEEERQGGGHNRIAEDAVYTVMATGQQVRGYQAVVEFLDSLYRGGLQASAKRIHEVIGDGSAAFEYEYHGRHVGEFGPTLARALGLPEGVPTSGREVTVPFCVVYTVDGEQIKGARIYFEIDSLRRQLGL